MLLETGVNHRVKEIVFGDTPRIPNTSLETIVPNQVLPA